MATIARLVDTGPRPVTLTPQEVNAVQFLANGYRINEAAALMFLSPKTVKAHLLNARRRNDARTSTELVARAVREGMIR